MQFQCWLLMAAGIVSAFFTNVIPERLHVLQWIVLHHASTVLCGLSVVKNKAHGVRMDRSCGRREGTEGLGVELSRYIIYMHGTLKQ